MVTWTWWDWSLSLGLLLPSVLWHCWLGPSSPCVQCKHVHLYRSAPAAGCLTTPTVTGQPTTSPLISPASQPRPPPTLLASQLQTLVVLIIVLIFRCCVFYNILLIAFLLIFRCCLRQYSIQWLAASWMIVGPLVLSSADHRKRPPFRPVHFVVLCSQRVIGLDLLHWPKSCLVLFLSPGLRGGYSQPTVKRVTSWL